jgi:SP family myo-inositol transporter-like MFS transporter 13
MTGKLCLRSLNWIQGVIVSAAVFAAALGSALGGAFGDYAGRRRALLVGDALFASGAILMAAAQGVGTLIAGKLSQSLDLILDYIPM